VANLMSYSPMVAWLHTEQFPMHSMLLDASGNCTLPAHHWKLINSCLITSVENAP